MKISNWAFGLLGFLGASVFVLGAQQAVVTPIEVSAFNCRTVQQPGASLTWFEVSVDLNAKSAPGVRFTERVKVALTLGFEKGTSAAKAIEFYQSSVELVVLETGRVSTVRFYLPPEITKRDGLYGAPKYFAVALTNGGKELPMSKEARSSAFTGREMLENFLTKAASEGAANNGVLVPQHLTPFYLDVTRLAPTPVQVSRNPNN